MKRKDAGPDGPGSKARRRAPLAGPPRVSLGGSACVKRMAGAAGAWSFDEVHGAVAGDLRVLKVRMFGRECDQPRRVAYYGDRSYGYSGTVMPPAPFPGIIREIRDAAEALAGLAPGSLNGCLVNLYRGRGDHVSWHSDNERGVCQRCIVSVSFGASRRFDLREKAKDGPWYQWELCDGDVLVMESAQELHEHRVPPGNRQTSDDPRLNLTFRKVGA